MWEKVDAIVCPSHFMLEKLAEGGFPRQKLHHIPTFVDTDQFYPCYGKGDYFLYFGRVSCEKGVSTLIEGFRRFVNQQGYTGLQLKIVGNSNDGERKRLERVVADDRIPGITFHDAQDISTLRETISKAICIIVPSIWYDNMPNVILESYACGKPVIASRLGSLPEIVSEGKTGFLFSPGDPDDLATCICFAARNLSQISEMGRVARISAETDFSPKTHYKKLMKVFNGLICR